jgi:CheY-like chemotaxis protein
MHILVVEDDEAVRQVLAQLLRRAGHTVADEASATRALQLLGESHFDLLCTDLGMPEMSGWELLAQARAMRPGLMTILITGWGEQIDAEEARRRNVDAVVAKPFDSAHLHQLIAALQQGASQGNAPLPIRTVM